MTTRQFVSTKGDTWEWEETPEAKEAIAKLHRNATERLHADIRKAETEASDYGVGK